MHRMRLNTRQFSSGIEQQCTLQLSVYGCFYFAAFTLVNGTWYTKWEFEKPDRERERESARLLIQCNSLSMGVASTRLNYSEHLYCASIGPFAFVCECIWCMCMCVNAYTFFLNISINFLFLRTDWFYFMLCISSSSLYALCSTFQRALLLSCRSVLCWFVNNCI